MLSTDEGGWQRWTSRGPAFLLDDVLRLTFARMVNTEESEALSAFIRQIRELEKQLDFISNRNNAMQDREKNMLEMEGMIRISRNDIVQVMTRSSA